MTILLNPVITPLSAEEVLDFEGGCLSVPGLRGEVPRFRHIRYQGFDPQGHTIDRTVEAARRQPPWLRKMCPAAT